MEVEKMSFVADERFREKVKMLNYYCEEFEGYVVSRLKCKNCHKSLLVMMEDEDGGIEVTMDDCKHFTWFILPHVCYDELKKDEKGRLKCMECIFKGDTVFCSKLFSVTVFSLKTKYCILLLLDKDELRKIRRV